MIFLIIFSTLVILLMIITAFSYRIAFYSPARGADSKLYELPKGEQYESRNAVIQKSIDEMLALEYEEITIASFDGKKLFGRYFHLKEGAPLQIQLHGYRSSAFLDFSGGCRLARKLGHNVLVVDQRSHGKSDGTTISFGINERKDCLSWIQYANERFGASVPIFLVGVSMGAATVLMTADLDLPENVKGIIADCPYSSPKDIIRKVCQTDMKLPSGVMYPFIKLGARTWGHFNLEESSAVEAVKHAKVPVLLLHGEADHFVPTDMSAKIEEACSSMAVRETFPDAGHALSYIVDPVRYETVISNFIADAL